MQVRTGHRTQGMALFTRMGDRFSTWDVSNGLQSIIPTLLTSGCAPEVNVSLVKTLVRDSRMWSCLPAGPV